MPGLLGARRRFDLANVTDHGGAGRRRVGDHRPEGVDVARARGRLVLRASVDRPRGARATGDCRTCSFRCASRGWRSARSCSSPARRSSTRCSSTAPAPRPPTWSATGDEGWRVAMGTSRSSGGCRLSACNSGSSGSSTAIVAGTAQRPAPQSGAPRSHGPGVDRPAHHALIALRGLAGHEAGTPGPEASLRSSTGPTWHRDLGDLAIDVLGADALVGDGCRTS